MKFEWHGRITSPTNDRGNWRKSAARAKRERERITEDVGRARKLKQLPPGPWLVVLTRYGKRKMDKVNCDDSFKHIQDGIADALGVDDGDESMVIWEYHQDKSSVFKVSAEIKSR